MNMIQLPDGRFINPAHAERVSIHSHLFSSDKWYLQITLRNGHKEDVAERMTKSEAEGLRREYGRMIADVDISAYEVGLEDGTNLGYEKGRMEGYVAGRNEGYNAGCQAGDNNARNQFLQNLHKRRNLISKQQVQTQNSSASERRRLTPQIELLTELIGEYSLG